MSWGWQSNWSSWPWQPSSHWDEGSYNSDDWSRSWHDSSSVWGGDWGGRNSWPSGPGQSAQADGKEKASPSISSCTWLGGQKRGALPLTKQGELLAHFTRLSKIKQATHLAAFYLLFRIDASKVSLASLGSTEEAVLEQLRPAW